MNARRFERSLARRSAGPARRRIVQPIRFLHVCVALMFALSSVLATAQDTGTISGRVFDGDNGLPLENATVILVFPDAADGTDPRQEIATSGPDGDYEFDAIPAGFYVLSFVKSGYRASSITNFEVLAGQDNTADFPMPAQQVTAGGDVMELDAFVVEADLAGDLMNSLELRLESDQSLNLLSAEDLSKFAASDVADALKRVAGVNIVEGQFAVVRGLEDRYTSTLFNGAPIPSPDPDRQSIQLDLFPSDVVTNLVVAKTFDPNSPSNSAAGSIDIMTLDYPEQLEFKVSLGAGFEEGALDRFLEFNPHSPVGDESNQTDVVETDAGLSFGGRFQAPIIERELRFRGVFNHEVDYRSFDGFQESREPRFLLGNQGGLRVPQVPSDLAAGRLSLSDGRFQELQSEREEQWTVLAGFGFDLDEEQKHTLDFTAFYTKKTDEVVRLRENGYFTGFDYSQLIQLTNDEDDLFDGLIELEGTNSSAANPVATRGSALAGQESTLRTEVSESPALGALWFSSFGSTISQERERELQVYQFNGGHEFDLLSGLDVSWIANHATTAQSETTRGTRFFYEPCGWESSNRCPAGVSRRPAPTVFPVTVEALGPGRFFASGRSQGITINDINIEEVQWFGRVDLDQSIEPFDFVSANLRAGVWWEKSRRSVDARFVENATPAGAAAGEFAVSSPTLQGLGSSLISSIDLSAGNRLGSNRSRREITAGYLNLKATLWDDLDLLGGLRLEKLEFLSENNPLTGERVLGRPAAFPTAYLFFDRRDNPNPLSAGGEAIIANAPQAPFNDQVLGLNPAINPSTGFVDLLTPQQILDAARGEIDELKVLPSVSLAYRPIEGLTLRLGYSETVARPSFRELGYYASVDTGSGDQVVGNPLLQLSDVRSYDFRAEYVFGDVGDLVAFSAFYKTIDDPIESIVVRDPNNQDGGSEALFRTFFNNPSTARIWGIEVEARKTIDFLPDLGLDFLGVGLFEYLSIGGNFSYFDAKVKRSPFELTRAREAFIARQGEPQFYSGLEAERRLFGQPEWIANADLSFDHPDWGTTLTLAFFAISDILDSAGTTSLGPNSVFAERQLLDRYLDSFYQLDLVASQRIWGGLSVKASVKNLTNTTRRRIYDQQQTSQKYTERLRRFGRDWSFAVSYSYEF